ncbi:MAG TPA: hypothetical protein VJ785_09405 [Anaerolineales bacterium]|nr:hypothetical protein [Anaerolineales bacterium]
MTRRMRILLGLLILAVSLSILLWGLWPARRETRVQPIPPADLQLPTPASFRFDTVPSPSALLPQLFPIL